MQIVYLYVRGMPNTHAIFALNKQILYFCVRARRQENE